MKVPQLDLQAQFAGLRAEMMKAVEDVFSSQGFILGQGVADLEAELAGFLGVPDTIGVSSGSEALRIALAVCDIGPGDEVLLPSFTFFATAGAVVQVGARPVFCDVGEDMLLDPDDVMRRLTPRSKAIMPVHLYGLQAPLGELSAMAGEVGAFLIEDAAQSLGATNAEGKSGTIGDAGAFSFFPSKNLGAAGDAGLLLIRDDDRRERARRFRVHGESRRYHHEEVGVNGRLDALQAAVLSVKLPMLDSWNRARRERARRYDSLLAASALADRIRRPALPEAEEHVFHQYTLRAPRRDEALSFLQESGIGAAVYYPVPLHRQSCFASGETESLPVTDALAAEVLSLPIYPELTDSAQDYVVEKLLAFYR